MTLKTALMVLITAASLTALTACAKKDQPEQAAAAQQGTANEAELDNLPVTDTPVSEDMMDAAPVENEQAASEAK